MGNYILLMSALLVIVPEAFYEIFTAPGHWHAWLAFLVAITSVGNHATNSRAWRRVDRLAVWTIGCINVRACPDVLTDWAILVLVLYFGIVRDLKRACWQRDFAHIAVHIIGAWSNAVAKDVSFI